MDTGKDGHSKAVITYRAIEIVARNQLIKMIEGRDSLPRMQLPRMQEAAVQDRGSKQNLRDHCNCNSKRPRYVHPGCDHREPLARFFVFVGFAALALTVLGSSPY